MRLKELSDYAAKMERYNSMLEQEKRMYQQDMHAARGKSYSFTSTGRTGGTATECCENWRDKIKVLKHEQEIFNQ